MPGTEQVSHPCQLSSSSSTSVPRWVPLFHRKKTEAQVPKELKPRSPWLSLCGAKVKRGDFGGSLKLGLRVGDLPRNRIKHPPHPRCVTLGKLSPWLRASCPALQFLKLAKGICIPKGSVQGGFSETWDFCCLKVHPGSCKRGNRSELWNGQFQSSLFC